MPKVKLGQQNQSSINWALLLGPKIAKILQLVPKAEDFQYIKTLIYVIDREVFFAHYTQ